MKRQFYIFLILIFILGLVPINFSEAITQNQINAEVQIVCTDGIGSWFSGSGTIIDHRGIILTNRHVIEGAYKNTCFIGFLESINKEPDFGTETNRNLAEVKYITSTADMDAAIMYLDNPNNKIYPYVNIWNSDSNTLQFGDKIEAIGFPSIGGSTITYTSGDFSGFGSKSDGTQNYIKTTTQLEHGNSGGASYNSNGQFIGIPTMVVAGTLNSLSYLLSVNSIKNWLYGILGSGYEKEVVEHTPAITQPSVNIQNDITPPNFNTLKQMCLSYFDDNHNLTGSGCFPANMGKISSYNHIKFEIPKEDLYKIDSSGLKKVYYYFDTIPHTQIDSSIKKYTINDSRITITDLIDIDKQGKYYFSFFGEDNNGNLSAPTVYEYIYETETFKTINGLFFYKDSGLKNFIKSYDVNFNAVDRTWQQESLECSTRLNSLTIAWEYPREYSEYVSQYFNSWRPLAVISIVGNKNKENKYSLTNLSKGKKITWSTDYHQSYSYQEKLSNIYYEFYLKPVTSGYDIEEKHRLIKLVYDPNLNEDISCRENFLYTRTDRKLPPKSSSNTNKTSDAVEKLKGKILLQVQSHGEAYYVYPKDGKKYYMANGNEAYRIMRYLGVGITNKDLDNIKNNKTFAKKNSGKIFLQVESKGEAYYIDFNGIAHYLKDGSAAYTIMRELGLGITNSDLSKISEGNL